MVYHLLPFAKVWQHSENNGRQQPKYITDERGSVAVIKHCNVQIVV